MMRSSSSTLDYNSPNRDSSSKLSSSPNGERPRNQTLDHNILSFQPNKPARRDNRNNNNNNNISPEPNPNPNYPDPIPTTTPITPVNAVNAVLSSSSSSLVRYRECLKNHAASSGGLVLDGCGEFMPSGDEGTVEAMKCAACECHRNFHLKEIDGESQYNVPIVNIGNSVVLHQQHYPPPHLPQLSNHHNPHYHHRDHQHPHPVNRHRPIAPPVMMAFGGAESSSEDLNMFDHDHDHMGQSKAVMAISMAMAQQAASGAGRGSKKRFRTKFNQEQKEKMIEFAEKLGWRIQRHDDQEVQRFCSEVGVKRQVFKVWMHNNKQTMKKKQV
ncbi:hypothetical protein TIFTF001_002459 [Ficus carica]|uniref:ZF-HD dimerization-type domain-containing protein n=1 Tax=Ficus carica TaxID=3494 RepID=A0AA87ZBM8_FICCA|nr:hypothetical protein TIFTF001_002459 [Ficus carica]